MNLKFRNNTQYNHQYIQKENVKSKQLNVLDFYSQNQRRKTLPGVNSEYKRCFGI